MRYQPQEPAFIRRRRAQLAAAQQPKKTVKNGLYKIADWLDSWHLTRIFQALSSFLLIATLIVFYSEYQDRKEARKVAAWQLLTTKAPGNSGKIQALEYLNSIGEPLTGIDLSVDSDKDEAGVYLQGVQLKGANLKNAKLKRVDLSKADLTEAGLERAILSQANLSHADLRGANLSQANLSHTDLSGANLFKANLFRADFIRTNILFANLRGAYLFGAKNLICEQLTNAKFWQEAYRDKELACGAGIPALTEDDKKLFEALEMIMSL